MHVTAIIAASRARMSLCLILTWKNTIWPLPVIVHIYWIYTGDSVGIHGFTFYRGLPWQPLRQSSKKKKQVREGQFHPVSCLKILPGWLPSDLDRDWRVCSVQGYFISMCVLGMCLHVCRWFFCLRWIIKWWLEWVCVCFPTHCKCDLVILHFFVKSACILMCVCSNRLVAECIFRSEREIKKERRDQISLAEWAACLCTLSIKSSLVMISIQNI